MSPEGRKCLHSYSPWPPTESNIIDHPLQVGLRSPYLILPLSISFFLQVGSVCQCQGAFNVNKKPFNHWIIYLIKFVIEDGKDMPLHKVLLKTNSQVRPLEETLNRGPCRRPSVGALWRSCRLFAFVTRLSKSVEDRYWGHQQNYLNVSYRTLVRPSENQTRSRSQAPRAFNKMGIEVYKSNQQSDWTPENQRPANVCSLIAWLNSVSTLCV